MPIAPPCGAIAKLAGAAGNVYDRGMSLFLADHGLDPARAVTLARDELAVRPDVYGYDTLAWALLARVTPSARRPRCSRRSRPARRTHGSGTTRG